MEKAKVSILKCDNYEFQNVYNSIKKSLDLIGGISKLKESGKKVLLKPNILAGAEPEKAVTTHPVFIDAVITLFKENDFDIYIGDSPGLEDVFNAAKKCGIIDVIEKHNLKLSSFNDYVTVNNPDGVIVKKFNVAKITQDVDFIVSLPKLKTHSQMYFTGGMKNLFGVIPGLQKPKFHLQFEDKELFAQMIVDLNILLKPALCIMDGILAMEGNGPGSGDPYNLGLILSSFDILALDIIACEIIGYNPVQIPIVKKGLENGKLWVKSISDIEIVGEDLNKVRKPHFKKIHIPGDIAFVKRRVPKFLYNIVRNIIIKKPFFNMKKCILCKNCINICPADALQVGNRNNKEFIKIDYEKCIRCYCCHEICPVKAIDLKSSL